MPDSLLAFIRHGLPDELREILSARITELEGGEYEKILQSPLAQDLLGRSGSEAMRKVSFDSYKDNWMDFVFDNAVYLLGDRSVGDSDRVGSGTHRFHFILLVAIAALQAFVQASVTGPPLPFRSATILFPEAVTNDAKALRVTRRKLLNSLSVDGEAAFKLIPNVELICLADTILTIPSLKKYTTATEWVKLRIDFLHQRLLSDISPTLQTLIYDNFTNVESLLTGESFRGLSENVYFDFLLEQVTIHLHHGFDRKAREILDEVARKRKFAFALTGLLGKRTKYQENDISQLVVLARSFDDAPTSPNNHSEKVPALSVPDTVDLDDDTLLERIAFSEKPNGLPSVVDENALPQSLSSLDPSNQPLLHPLDAIILLLLASSITNISPGDGLTREETLPYATRVLQGGSSNWQIYSQALVVRSRIEGYRSRTIERGLFQLQAIVDQVIAETTPLGGEIDSEPKEGAVTTFLPRAKEVESAPAQERLQYVYALSSPTRWELEAELASRWVSLGGMRSALEIYERLEMWPEAALCWAAADREDKAKRIIRRQLFHATHGADDSADAETEKWEGAPREPPPSDAPRLYCILGDLDDNVTFWQKAWDVSSGRYARAQRTLGRHYFAARDYSAAADAYSKALQITRLNQPSWFALGCCLLELMEFDRAIEAFSRVIQLDDTDAEAYSNLAAALLSRDPSSEQSAAAAIADDETDAEFGENTTQRSDIQRNRRDALQALKRAAALQHDNARIWDNLLTVAASLQPPAYMDVLNAQRRIVELRASTQGERCVDATILEYLVRHVIDVSNESTTDGIINDHTRGLPRLVCELVDTMIVPLITTSGRLWRIVAMLALWRQLPVQALQAHEKAWRATTAQPGWEVGTEAQWNEVVVATEELVDAYESLGERTGEINAEQVAKDWKFKARSALRGIMGKARASWTGSEGWQRLEDKMGGLKAGS